ncbi:MAG: AraC family ligand binding domain-containing protein, partial [Cyclobacteriaceae bacterium]
MENFFRYLTSGPEDKEWGIYLTVGGRYTSIPHSIYPQTEHPSGYYFDWNSGRVLNEYQLNFISEGSGILETESGKFFIEPGTLMIIEPGKWHRYRPDPETGWTEYYIGFDGDMAKHFISNTFNSLNEQPTHQSSNQLEILDTYQKILDLVSTQKPGYHQIASGLIIKLMGYIKGRLKSKNFDEMQVESLVNNAKNYIWEHVHENADLKEYSR